MKLRAAVLSVPLVLGLGVSSADAALTSSEKGQLRDFLASAKIENVGRARTLVARTDHTEEDAIAALSEAVAPVPWTQERATFIKEMVFGGASQASRPLLAVAATRSLLARADAVYQKYVGGLDHEPRAIAELVSIYSFLDGEIANARTSGIPPASYESASKAVREHVEKNSRWLKGDGVIAESAGRVRAEGQVLLFDMLPEGGSRRVDAADRLGLKGARRQMLTDWGVLLEDAGKVDDTKADKIRHVLAKLPGARIDLSVIYAGEDRGPLRAKSGIVFVGAGGADAYPFADEVSPGPYDKDTAGIAYDLSVVAARRALDNRGELRLQAERDAIAAQGDPTKLLGKPRGPGVDQVVGAAVHLLVTDAPRAFDLAFLRFVDNRKESVAILSDAIGALAAYAPPATGGKGPQIDLGKPVSEIRLAANGVATSFVMDGKTWAIDRAAPTFAVTRVTRDGQPVALGNLSTARMPVHAGATWSEGGYVFTKMHGTPLAGLAAGGDKGVVVKVTGSSGKGYDAIATTPSSDDFVVEGDVNVTSGSAGIGVRSAQGRDAVRGALLMLTPGGRTMLVSADDTGGESNLGPPIDSTPSMPVHVKITVQGKNIDATVGSGSIKGTLPATLAKGDVAVFAKKGATVEVTGFTIKKTK